ncbi:hypothetical protein MMC16_007461 [Acarospora aff. strigata]|nr:hypothetical protein [Acarospora aff. strigata]
MASPPPPPPPLSRDTHPIFNKTFALHRVSPLYHGPISLSSSSSSLFVSSSERPTSTSAPFLSAENLSQHARRFGEILRGDVLRGVHVGGGGGWDPGEEDGDGGEGGLGKAGAVRGCEWRVLRDGERERERVEEDEDEGDSEEREKEQSLGLDGILIEIHYETNTYTALMLRSSPRSRSRSRSLPGSRSTDANAATNEHDNEFNNGNKEIDQHFTHLPLLLTRMPAPLRNALTSYLSTTFDARISALKLSSAFLVSTLENYLEDLSTGPGVGTGTSTGAGTRSSSDKELVEEVMKDIHITLTFSAGAGAGAGRVAPALKTLDMTIARDDVVHFLRRGRSLPPPPPPPNPHLDAAQLPFSSLASRKRKVPPSFSAAGNIPNPKTETAPFVAALRQYLNVHVALDMAHPDVGVGKIGCGAFVVAGEGRVKVLERQWRRGEGGGGAGEGRGGDDGGGGGEDREGRAVRRFLAGLVRRAMGEHGDETSF